MHYYRGILQNLATFALFDALKMGNLMTPALVHLNAPNLDPVLPVEGLACAVAVPCRHASFATRRFS